MPEGDYTLGLILKELQSLNAGLRTAITALEKAESEIPEHMRRFMMYMHDLVHVRWAYEEKGIMIPPYIDEAIEYAHDRLRVLIDRENQQGGAFDRGRQDLLAEGGMSFRHDRRGRRRI